MCLGFQQGKAQRIIELGIKPTELIFLNTEVNFAMGNMKNRYGVFLSYRPSTQNSGLIKSGGSGAAGGYGHNHFNKLYTSYTLGVYQKIYFKRTENFFLETDIFFRNWDFEKKLAKFSDAEGYRFNGLRTEHVNVYGLKVLAGKTFFLKQKSVKYKVYLDVFAGFGIRYKESNYETFKGYVYDIYYDYKKEMFTYFQPTPQLGVKLGVLKIR